MTDDIEVEILSDTVDVDVGGDWAVQWSDLLNVPANVTALGNVTGGSTGNVLKKTASGMEWDDIAVSDISDLGMGISSNKLCITVDD